MKALACWLMLLLGAFSHGGAMGTELGRLFLSPAERAAIDAARHASAEVREVSSADAEHEAARSAEPVAETPAEAVTVNGYIARSAGASTVWVNGRDMAPGKLSAPSRDGRRVHVPLANGAGQVALKPGQSFDPESHQISDAYQQRPPPRE
jgi:hypothetical protein